jgi:aromatic ring-opening dioxygenase catalytic subunit (LigB family)
MTDMVLNICSDQKRSRSAVFGELFLPRHPRPHTLREGGPMSNRTDAPHPITRRQVVAAGLAGAAALAVGSTTENDATAAPKSSGRLPVVYLPHGGGPWPFVDFGMGHPAEFEDLKHYLRSLRTLAKPAPTALLVVSAHWEAKVATVTTSPRPPMLYDYYGFPAAAYEIQWPAPGHPQLATRVQALLATAGLESTTDAQRGFDHGTFVPLKVAWPEAALPTVQLSLLAHLDPAAHLRLGQALAPLRDEGVLILGSGMSYHNMRGFGGAGRRDSETFDAWLRATVPLPAAERHRQLAAWTQAPAARAAHPREEHLLPLMVVAGAAGQDSGRLGWGGTFMGARLSAWEFG